MPRPSLAVQLHSFREAMASDGSGTLARIAELGYRAVEPAGIGRRADAVEAAVRLRAELDAAGLIAPSATARAPLDELAAPVLEALEALGVGTAVIATPEAVPGFDNDAYRSKASVEKLADRLAEAATNLAERGIRLAYHNHWRDFTVLEDGSLGYEYLLDCVPEVIGAEIDIYWAQAAGQDVAQLITRLGKRVWMLHLKDGPAEPKQPQTALGTGVVDVRGAVEAASAAQWHIVEFDRCDTDVFEAAQASGDWLIDHGYSTWELPEHEHLGQ